MKKRSYIIIGIILIALGVIWVLRALGIADFSLFFDGWWTLFIIVPSVMAFFSDREKTLPAIGILGGVLMLLASREIIRWGLAWSLFPAGLIVILGISFIFNGLGLKKRREATPQYDENLPPEGERPKVSRSQEFASTFSSRTIDFSGTEFRNADVTAVFGSVTLDLRNALFGESAQVNVYVTFGAVTVLLPENVPANIRVVPVFGGASDKRPSKPAPDGRGVTLSGTVLFGGAVVK